MMKISDFQKYIDLHGADLSRWPRHEVRPAIDLIQHNPEAGKFLAGAEKLDQMLRHYAPAPVNAAKLTAKIMRQTKQVQSKAADVINATYIYASGGGLLMVAIIGFMIGFHASVKENTVLDPVFYTQDLTINDSEEAS